MQFGIFDQNDRNGRPLADQYEERLQMAELYDHLGFDRYHMSEHHTTPLSTTPSPSVFIAALSQRTSRLRFCPLVYLLPMHHPLRLAEEICMLDQLSRGRFEFGVGRGASPHELAAFGVDPAQSPQIYAEAFTIIRAYLTAGDTLDHAGPFWTLRDVPVELAPFQKPHPPIWYACASPDSAVWPAQNGINIVCGGPVPRLRALTDRYRAEWHASHPKGGPEPRVGANRFIVVAPTDAEALAIARAAWPRFHESFWKLWWKHGTLPVNSRMPAEFDALIEAGQAFCGSPARVAEGLARQIREAGLNYLIGNFVFGTMAAADAQASVRLFARAVMPVLRAEHAVSA
jgi:alkanesulfonate monooxygenase SsuD/methylene tetrahydromethanopterin reductase-like flavin-dependent oxidoreductase (luciferase family)